LAPLVPPSKSLSLTVITLLSSIPLLVESVLLIRLWAVYPFRSTPRKIFFAIFIPIILLKMGRVVNIIVFIVDLSRRFGGADSGPLLLQRIWTTFPNYKIGWFLQVVDNTSVSVLFLLKLNKGRELRTRVGGRNLGSTLEALFWIAVSNFVIPVILSIAELVVVWTSNDIFYVTPICVVNLYTEIIGVLLATVWTAGTKWQDNHKDSHESSKSTPEVQVLPVTTATIDISWDI
jgi:hypothetical protein